MKNFLLAFFALILAPITSNAQVSDCVIDLVIEAYAEYITVGAVDFPEGATLNWSIDGVMMNNGNFAIDLQLAMLLAGPVEVCVYFETPECPDGIEICETIDIEDLLGGGEDCTLEMDYDIYDYEGYAVFEAYGHPEGVNLIWYINETVFAEGTSTIQVTEDDIEGLEELVVCVMYESEDCPQGVWVCEDFFDGEDDCILVIEGYYQVGYGYAEVYGYPEGANLIWYIDGVQVAEGTDGLDLFGLDLPDVFEICCKYVTEDCGSVEECIMLGEGVIGDCTITLEYEMTENGNVIFEASNYPEGVDLMWYLNGEVLVESSNIIDVEMPTTGFLEVCVGYESPECPWGAFDCVYVYPDCSMELDGWFQQGFGYAEAYGYPEGANLIWYLDGEPIAEGVSFIEVNSNDLPEEFELCVMYTTEDCGSVESCEWFNNGSGEGDCPEEIYAIMPKWDMCSWAFGIESNNDFADVGWNFGDGSDTEWGSNWMSHTYSNDGIYIVTAEYYSQSCPNGTFITLTIQVEGCGESGDCTLQMEPLYEMNGNIMGWAYDYPEGVNLIWTIDDEVIAEGVSSIDVNSNDLPEEFELCVSYHTEECGEVTVCEQYETDAVNDFESEASWSVYPVPTSDGVTLEGLSEGVYTCKMVDSQGRLVLEKKVSNGTTISLDDITNGIYSLQIVDVNSSVIINSAFKPVYKFKRVVVQR
ncbi:MAG: T9SS type A sorting domain-containing protein [Flavobacteriales bacterium]